MVSLLKLLVRFVGFLLLAVALVAAVVDGSKSIAASTPVFTPVVQVWLELSPATLDAARAAVEHHAGPLLWDPVLKTVLAWPVWAVAAGLAFVLMLAGDRRRRRAVVL